MDITELSTHNRISNSQENNDKKINYKIFNIISDQEEFCYKDKM